MEPHSAVGAVPFSRARGNLRKANAVKMEPFSIALEDLLVTWKRDEREGITYILVLTTDHCPKAHVPAHAIPGLVGVNLLKHPVFIHANIL